MSRYGWFLLALAALLWGLSDTRADTWRLEEGGGLRAVSQSRADRYLLAVAEIKKLVNAGKAEEARKAVARLKTDFPEVAGADLDAFFEAELLFAQGSYVKAMRAYDDFLARYPKSKLYEAALDRQYAIGTAYLDGRAKPVLKFVKIKGYAEGAKIMDRIVDKAGDAPIAVEAAVAVARSYEKRDKFEEAYQKWSEISSRWPTGKIGKDALLGMARCKHAAYRGPKYNASDLLSAKTYYENFKLRYPEDAARLDIDKRLQQINEQLAYKNFSVGLYYEQTGNKESAHFYYKMVLDGWPESMAAKMARARMVRNEQESEKVKK